MWKRLGTAVLGFGDFSEESKLRHLFFKKMFCLFAYRIENISTHFLITPTIDTWSLYHFYLNLGRT